MSWRRRLPRWRSILIFLAITLSIVAAMELGAYLIVQRTSYFHSWEYVTVEHPEFGFVPRPGARSMWSGVPIQINESGLRSQTAVGSVEPRKEGEYLVLCVGDSTTFGNSVPFENTYPSVLESLLRERSGKSVRVVNLGVPGHQSAQSLAWLESWLTLMPDVVVFADSFNNRVHMPHERLERPHELAGRPIYLTVLFRQIRGKLMSPPVPLSLELPAPRIDTESYRRILGKLIELSNSTRFRLVLVAGGDHPTVEFWGQHIRQGVQTGLWPHVLEQSARLRTVVQTYYLPWYYEHRALLELGRDDEARDLAARYEASETAGVYYLNRFVRFAEDYIAVMRQMAQESKVSFIDMRPFFVQDKVEFLDITHFESHGHSLVAEALADTLLNQDTAESSSGNEVD